MNKILHETEVASILQRVLEKKIPVILSFFSEGQWSILRTLMTKIDKSDFSLRITPRKKTSQSQSIMRTTQSIGISFKDGFGANNDKFVFDTTVSATGSSDDSPAGVITLAMPEQIEVVQRRSFIRVKVPRSMDIDVSLTRHEVKKTTETQLDIEAYHAWQGKLIDISADGLAVAVSIDQGPDFETGEFIKIDFTPLPHETALMFNAYVRNLPASADGEFMCVGLEIIGLEASPEGRLVLQRICGIIRQYEQL